jgi:hypothetical protein|tara:strand:- start:1137 stop:1316 length:180 start_codon:yes stop_codon:yes gene_type:complete
MSAKDKPISKPMSKQFEENYDRIFNNKPIGQSKKPKDRVDLGLSPSCVIEEIDCTRDKK